MEAGADLCDHGVAGVSVSEKSEEQVAESAQSQAEPAQDACELDRQFLAYIDNIDKIPSFDPPKPSDIPLETVCDLAEANSSLACLIDSATQQKYVSLVALAFSIILV